MDRGPDIMGITEQTTTSLQQADDLASLARHGFWLVRYAFAPCFILSCTDEFIMEDCSNGTSTFCVDSYSRL